ncbi:MAG: hypothetical protein Q9184_000839 [Pyrenodesmia sp. 2 TL-2023]
MTLPPERITVKRQRDEEPVDALCILSHCISSRDSLTPVDFPPHKSRKTFIWNRIPNKCPEHDSRKEKTLLATGPSRIPTVRTTLPEEDHIQGPSASPASSPQDLANNASGDTTQPSHRTTGSGQRFSSIQNVISTRLWQSSRKFHLTRTSAPSKTPSVLYSGIQKSKKRQIKNLAIFIERTDSNKKSQSRGIQVSDPEGKQSDLRSGLSNPSAEPSSAKKRPLASPFERAWRDRTWKQPPQSTTNEGPTVVRTQEMDSAPDSLHLASQLQQFALEVSQVKNASHGVHTNTRTKIKPKPPRPRPAKADGDGTGDSRKDHGDGIELLETKEEESENYVFDVFVRHAEQIEQKASVGMQNTMLQPTDLGKIGVLVIADEDQETWELYGAEDQSSDDEWNSEEEDENAENYYGNDYPEDELDSDDEYDRYTYKHWHGAFDDEEFEDDINWSDNEHGTKE